MNFDPASLFASMLVSSVGFVLFQYGRRQRRVPHTGIGLVMLVYPYAVTNIGWMLGLVPVLLALLWVCTLLGM
jgi:CHASE2 domain-containing sensor protein